MVKLFVGGFPLDIEEIELAKLFAPHGDISTIKIVRDKKTKLCKGYAFIEMNDKAGAEAAVEALNGTMLDDKELTVKISEDPTGNSSLLSEPTAPQQPPIYQKVLRPGNEVKKKRPRRSV
jgi:RNA recognition motif-containing protein